MQVFTSRNGLTVVSVPFRSSSVGIAFGVSGGSRDDPPAKRELHHALEHVLLRASAAYPTWGILSRFVETFTEDLDAETDATSILISCTTLRGHLHRALSCVAELVLHPSFEAVAVACERERLRAEAAEDMTVAWVEESFDALLAGCPPRSMREMFSIPSMGPRELARLHRRIFVGRRAVLVVAGDVSPKGDGRLSGPFERLSQGRRFRELAVDYRAVRGTTALRRDQSFPKILCRIGFPTFGFGDPDRLTLGLIRAYLSSYASSRLGVRLDAAGKSYTTNDFLWFERGIGKIGIQLSVLPEKFLGALRVVGEEIVLLREHGIPTRDIEHYRSAIGTHVAVRFTDPLYTACFYGRQWVNLGRVVPVEEYCERLRSVGASDVRRAVARVFDPERLIVVATGPLNGISRRDIKLALRLSKGR